MNAIDLLNAQQLTVDGLFAQADRAIRLDLKERLFVSIADALAIRATIEERIFYPHVLGEWTEEALRESLQEQFGIKRLIADLLELRATSPGFEEKLQILKEQAQHQARSEKSGLFPKVTEVVDDDQLRSIGHDMQSMMDALEGTDARYLVRGRSGALMRGLRTRKKQIA